MRTWTDPQTGCKMCEPNCAEEWLQHIQELAIGYDGCSKAEDLKDLIDEMVQSARNAQRCLSANHLTDLSK